ncbi:low molecular weight phosphatase family protein [Aurantimonas sp. C2-6-R+9]|uniref:arsenate-mycothiol transferase ArsC n=1 Tax=unclassified Aurantimonas TaxID=2638230 RepID=UPI002E185F79|nr:MULTISPECIES: low molecular weight phosphatase family protein [unclassified Aurantimonas]MEC5291797.1 low molecular weight phosphatase family protein [Aurantimonas sp. C2-3-R2]MEC5322793.1 low molecular weight phosphatase family protein [Aurantimonas sp. A3-2-R12]MEC5381938.1 low molecular weight phosphatase family protein [Aurantimonas sp. C2-6-R+9]MEC5412882.1 low molecular weight phosphatase family protein [Aurantimonas sp. C2-4-R8]
MTAVDPSGKVAVSSLLFVCGMNAIRSPIAEAIARSILPASVYIASAGVRSGQRDPFVDIVLAERGLSLGDYRPKRFEELQDGYFDLIVTMAPEAHHAALDATGTASVDVEFWPMPDPSVADGSREQILDAYRAVCDRIEAHIRRRLLEKNG